MSLICNELHNRGIGITVWTTLPDKCCSYPFTVRYFATGRKARFHTSPRAMLIYIVKVVSAAMRWNGLKPDLIFSCMGIPAGIAGAFLYRILKTKHAVWYHGADIHQNRPQGAGLIFKAILKFIWRSTAANLFVSESLQNMAKGYGAVPGPGILPVAPGVPLRAFDALNAKKTRVFLFAGRLEPVKNPQLIVEAARLIVARGTCPGIQFRIVGDGVLRTAILGRIRKYHLEHVFSLEESVDAAGMEEIYRDAYAFVLASRAEAFPTTILEAAYCYIPSIGANTVGISDIILDNITGLLFTENSRLSLAESIERLHADSDFRNQLGIAAHRMNAKYTVQNSADMLLSYFS